MQAVPCARAAFPSECWSLASIGRGLQYGSWLNGTNEGWLSAEDPCGGGGDGGGGWRGVKCDGNGHVVGLDLSHHGIRGFLDGAVGGLPMLEELKLTGHRPATYVGCAEQNLGRSELPMTLWQNCTALRVLSVEYVCLAGALPPAVGRLLRLEDLSLHGNYFNGTIPAEVGQLTALQTLKLGRNPLSGAFPDVSALRELETLGVNFCSLTGTVPDVFGSLSKLQIAYFDGNGFTGHLPASLASCKALWSFSFNINNLTGAVPSAYCDLPLLTDCRIGGDTNLTEYQADAYPWLQPVVGNRFECASLPACATGNRVCDRTAPCGPNGAWKKNVTGPCSPIACH
jgi:hypothetical protein